MRSGYSQDEIVRESEQDWPNIPPKCKAIALSYVQNCYDVSEVASELRVKPSEIKKCIENTLVRYFITEIAKNRHETSYITKDFITSHYVEMLPKLMGKEEVPMVAANGASFEAFKFHPGDAIKVLSELGKSIGYYTEIENKEPKKYEVHVKLPDEDGTD